MQQPQAPARELAAAREHRAALLACAAACAALALSGVFPVNNPDAYGHLAQGRQIAQLGHVPAVDTLSFWRNQPQPWTNYEWASDLLGFWIHDAFGPNGLIALKCAALASAAALLGLLAFLLGGPRAALACAVLLVAAIPAARFRFTERPHVVALPLAAVYLIAFAYLLRAWGRGGRRADAFFIAGLFALHVAWVNLHGSHLLGLMLTVVCCVFGFRRLARGRLGLLLGLQLAASCISPYGPAIVWDAVAHILDTRYRMLVVEWEPWKATDPFWFLGAPMLHTLLLACVVRGLWRGGAIGRVLLASVLLVGVAAFRSLRFVAEYLLLSSPVIAIGAGAMLDRIAWPRWRNAGALGVGLAAAFALWASPRLPPYMGIGLGKSELGLPAASGDWLAHHARAPRVLTAIEDAWYLMFAVPQARFLVDGRIPFYGPAHIARVREAFNDGAALDSVLEGFGVDTVVVRHTFAPQALLLANMRARPGWSLVTIEDRYAVFVRDALPLVGGERVQRTALQPGYELDWLLAADARGEQAIRDALAQLPAHESAAGYAGWVRAVLALKPLLRPGGHDGLRAPESAADFETLARVQLLLARAGRGAEGVPIVHALHALVAAARCDVDVAERAIDDARWEGESRETLLGAQEIAIRRGHREEVSAFVQQAAGMPQADHDAWLASLRESLSSPPRCP